jgi:hypothetical protein
LEWIKEAKRKRLEKEMKRKDMEKEKNRLYAIAKEERRLREEDMYPPPPYNLYAHYIPDSMYEELQLKRLLHGLYTTSDPEDTRRRKRIYPILPEEDYSYVQTQDLRHWINDEVSRERRFEEKTSGADDSIRKRPQLPTPRNRNRIGEDLSSSDEEPLKTYSIQRRPMRLRGGKSGSSDSDMSIASDGELPPNTRMTPSGKLVRKHAEKTPEKEANQDTDTAASARKKMKENEEQHASTLSAGNQISPGIGENLAKEFRTMTVKPGAKLSEIVISEVAKKKISMSVSRDIHAVNEAYQELVTELVMENRILLGRLWEARASEETEKMSKSKTVKIRKETVVDTEQPGPSVEVPVSKGQEVSRNRRRKNALKAKKQIRIADGAGRTDTEMTSDAATDVEFVEVRTKKKKKNSKRKGDSGPSGEDTNASTGRKSRKQKLEGLKNQAPQRVFVVDVGNDVNNTKKTIWADIVKKNGAPKITRQTVTTKGDKQSLQIVAADEATYKALKSITEEQTDVQLKPAKWPMLMIYDVDITLLPGEIARNILAQNTSLGNLVEEAATDKIRPIFRRGPREKDTVWWVCEVRPDIHSMLLKASRVYLGMSNCRVSEYFDFQQCFRCLKYGHREVFCKETTTTCTHCGEKGHKDTVCVKKQDPPKCANCGGNHVAHSKFCRERNKAIDNAVRKTDYKDPTCQQQ